MAAKRMNNLGSISKSGDFYRARFTDPTTHKQTRLPGKYESKEAAQKALNKTLHEIDCGKFVSPNKLTVAEYVNRWYNVFCADLGEHSKRKPSTRHNYRVWLDAYIIPRIGDMPIQKLKGSDYQSKVINPLTKAGKIATVRNVNMLFKQILACAVEDGTIPASPITKHAVQLPRYEAAQKECYSVQEIDTLIENLECSRTIDMLLYLLICSGIRIGEALALEWEDVSPDYTEIHICRNSVHVKGMSYVLTPKTKAGNRTIPLDPQTFPAVFRRQRANCNAARLKAGSAWNDLGLVFPNALGRHLVRSQAVARLKTICKQTGVPFRGLHQFRHAKTSRLLEITDIKTTMEILGHADARMTIGIYAHSSRPAKQKAAILDSRQLKQAKV